MNHFKTKKSIARGLLVLLFFNHFGGVFSAGSDRAGSSGSVPEALHYQALAEETPFYRVSISRILNFFRLSRPVVEEASHEYRKYRPIRSSRIKKGLHSKISALERQLEVSFSESSRKIIASYLESKGQLDVERFVQHGVRIYEGSVVDHLLLRYVSDNTEALNEFKHQISAEKIRRTFFNKWRDLQNHLEPLSPEFKNKRFHLLLLSLLEMDGQRLLIHRMTEPLFKENLTAYDNRNPELLTTSLSAEPYLERNRIPLIVAFWRLMSLVDPRMSDRFDFAPFIVYKPGTKDSDHPKFGPHRGYAFWGDAILARVVSGIFARGQTSVLDRRSLLEGQKRFTHDVVAVSLLKGYLSRKKIGDDSWSIMAAFFELTICVIYLAFGGSMGSGLESVERLLLKLFYSKWPELGRPWGKNLKSFVHHWLQKLENRRLADPDIRAHIKSMERLRSNAVSLGFHPTSMAENIIQAKRIVSVLRNEVSYLPERYRLRWKRIFLHTLTAIVAYSGYEVFAPLVRTWKKYSWHAQLFEIMPRYSSDPRWSPFAHSA